MGRNRTMVRIRTACEFETKTPIKAGCFPQEKTTPGKIRTRGLRNRFPRPLWFAYLAGAIAGGHGARLTSHPRFATALATSAAR